MLRKALVRAMDVYELFAGRIRLNPSSGSLDVDCNGAGAGFVMAESEYPLEEPGDLVYPNPSCAKLVTSQLQSLHKDDQPLFAFQHHTDVITPGRQSHLRGGKEGGVSNRGVVQRGSDCGVVGGYGFVSTRGTLWWLFMCDIPNSYRDMDDLLNERTQSSKHGGFRRFSAAVNAGDELNVRWL
ncbi:hypothetical protein DY000_02021108 [Brassica cretica]|uniref:Uncharacterized protein n=1 Tax=Brassica cretica TaxID=69181 RepID=A0ABQ7E9U7_BRACR|nr:hypothetical protein DY000_02021108 [Brassica cretica]